MAQSRNGSAVLKTAIVRKLNSDFQSGRVPGITETPAILQVRPRPRQSYPYIYVAAISDTETAKTIGGLSSREYQIHIQVYARSRHTGSQEMVRDAIVDEILRILDTEPSDYINLETEGYNNYIQNVDLINKGTRELKGGTFFYADMELSFTMDFIGTPVTRQPIQSPNFTFNGFFFTPTNNNIELYDSGAIVPATTYPSDNRGWDFTSTTFSLAQGARGTINGPNYVVGETDSPLGLDVAINYEFATDTSVTTTLNSSTAFNRIRSLRWGVVNTNTAFTDDTSVTTGLRDLSQWHQGERQMMFGTDNPTGHTITFNRTIGDYMYVVIDEQFSPTIFRENVFNENIIGQFNQTIIGGYRVYIFDREANFNDTITLTIL